MEPHQHCHIWRGGPTSGQHHPVTVNIPILNQSVTTAGTHVFFFILLSLTLLVCVSSSGRKGFVWTMRSPRRPISILLPLAVFISALYPTRNRLPIVLYLTLSTLGLLFILFGTYPALAYLRRWLPERCAADDVMKEQFQAKLPRSDLRYFLSLTVGFCICVSQIVFRRLLEC